MRFAVSFRRRSRSSPTAPLPFEDICKNLRLFYCVIESVVRVPVPGTKMFKEVSLRLWGSRLSLQKLS
jgi:hypothetical protein